MKPTQTPFQPDTEGIWLDLPADVYHKAPGVSQSTLKRFDEAGTPLHFKTAPVKKPTADMEFGTVCHTSILEPEKLAEAFYLRPDFYPAELKGKKDEPKVTVQKPWTGKADWCSDWMADHKDRPVLVKSDVEAVRLITERIKQLEPFARALTRGDREVSFFKRDEDTGLLLKARTDVFAMDSVGKKFIFDLKKVQSGCGSETEFKRQVENFGYHIQEASYKAITGADGFIFVAFDDAPPYDAVQWELHPQFSELGRREWRRILLNFAECVKTDSWPGYASGIKKLPMPDYGWKREKELSTIEHGQWLKQVKTSL
ncbi:MAG TPA: PD-(D/E)XK nuclease-like domain-containing protein [Verrucomicrobiae bacterium]|nr:PD-(D/E)XK nuclease-like domain-containing protein [Verrucomicrobiae bacterium]